jgi:hypothetical protein
MSRGPYQFYTLSTISHQVGSGSTVILMISGYMGSGEDYKRAFGVTPTHIGLKVQYSVASDTTLAPSKNLRN